MLSPGPKSCFLNSWAPSPFSCPDFKSSIFSSFLDQDHSLDDMAAVVKIEKGVGGNNGGNGNGGGAFSQARSSSTGSSSSGGGGGGGGQVSCSGESGKDVERLYIFLGN